MTRPPSAIPVGTQFSPELVDFPEFLQAICKHSADKPAMEIAVWQSPVRTAKVVRPPTRRRSSLPLEAARQYGLLDDTYSATSLAQRLSRLTGRALYEEFAKHILLNCGGLRVVEASQQMAFDEPESGVSITGDSLAAYLTDQGFRVTVHNTAINSMRLWLAKAGVYGENDWKVDTATKERLLGLSDADISALIDLTDEERAFALALCRSPPHGRVLASQVRENAEHILGHRAQRSSLPKLMEPLKNAGIIDYDSGGTRGGKSARVWTTPKFDAEVLAPFLEHATKQLDTLVADYYKRDFKSIHEDLKSPSTYVKGRALEAYAIQVMRRMGLRFVAWRERAKEHTGGAEVDVVMSGVIAGTPTRWQVQCKNTPRGIVRLKDVAKEVGLLPLTKATHILILANCRFSDIAITYAREIMRHSAATIFLLDQRDFEEIRATAGGALARILSTKSQEIASLKRHGLDWLAGVNRDGRSSGRPSGFKIGG